MQLQVEDDDLGIGEVHDQAGGAADAGLAAVEDAAEAARGDDRVRSGVVDREAAVRSEGLDHEHVAAVFGGVQHRAADPRQIRAWDDRRGFGLERLFRRS